MDIFNPTYWKEVIGYLWLPNLDDFKVLLNDNNVSVWSYSCFIIGKILLHLEFIKLFPHLENMENSVYLIWHS